MSHSDKMSGVLSPVITPLKDNLEPDSEKLVITAAGCSTTMFAPLLTRLTTPRLEP